MEMIKVSAQSRSTAVAGAIAGVMRERKYVEVQAIGASAVNQAIKAVAIARDYLALDGIPIVCIPEFVEVDHRRTGAHGSQADRRATQRVVRSIVTRPRAAYASPAEKAQVSWGFVSLAFFAP